MESIYDLGFSPAGPARLSPRVPDDLPIVAFSCHLACHFLSMANRSSFFDLVAAAVVAVPRARWERPRADRGGN